MSDQPLDSPFSKRPILCLVTDRRRLASGSTPGKSHRVEAPGPSAVGGSKDPLRWNDAADLLIEQVTAAGRAGIDLVQIRERDLCGRALEQLVRRCVDSTRATQTKIIVNDRLDVAIAAGAAGVHLRSDSISVRRARSLTHAGFLIGRSIHTADEAAAIDSGNGLDYLIFGTVFSSASKPGGHLAGLQALEAAARQAPVPVLAIGGVRSRTISLLRRAGAAGFAAIEYFLCLNATGGIDVEAMHRAVDAARRLFDTA